MLTLPRPCVSQDIAFFDDPEALGCLLHELIYLTTKTEHGEVLIGEIHTSARQLGYRGSIASIRLLLISYGFMSEVEQGSVFCIREENREIIEHFFDTHQSIFNRNGLTVLEKLSLFEHIGPVGSPVEVVLTQVMRSISFMLDILHTLPELHHATRESLALSEVEHLVACERVKWCDKRVVMCASAAEEARVTHGSDSCVFRDEFARYISMHLHMNDVIAYAEEQDNTFKRHIHDMETIELLNMLDTVLKKFTKRFVQKEIEGT